MEKVGPEIQLSPFRTAAPVLGTNYMNFDWLVSQNGAAVLTGLGGVMSSGVIR